jgi:hypothetical protein
VIAAQTALADLSASLAEAERRLNSGGESHAWAYGYLASAVRAILSDIIASAPEQQAKIDALANALERMVDLADYHVEEIESIATHSRDPADLSRAVRAREDYDKARVALRLAGRLP